MSLKLKILGRQLIFCLIFNFNHIIFYLLNLVSFFYQKNWPRELIKVGKCLEAKLKFEAKYKHLKNGFLLEKLINITKVVLKELNNIVRRNINHWKSNKNSNLKQFFVFYLII